MLFNGKNTKKKTNYNKFKFYSKSVILFFCFGSIFVYYSGCIQIVRQFETGFEMGLQNNQLRNCNFKNINFTQESNPDQKLVKINLDQKVAKDLMQVLKGGKSLIIKSIKVKIDK